MISKSILALVFLLTLAATAEEFALGSKIPHADRAMKNVDGKQVAVQDIQGKKGTVVVFWCNHCPYVIKYRSRMIAIANEYSDKGIGFIAVNSNDPKLYKGDSFDKMKAIAKEYKYPFPFVVDTDSKLAKAYGAAKTPHVFVFGADDKLIYVGAIDDSANPKKVSKHHLRKVLDALVAGKTSTVPNSRAFGCSIKWYKK